MSKNINIFLVITLFLITGCSGGESEVKKLSFQQCKDKTIEQVFNKNFTKHKWSSFTKNKKDFVQYEGIGTTSKNETVATIFLFSKNEVNMWVPVSIYVDGNNVTQLSFMFTSELCNKK